MKINLEKDFIWSNAAECEIGEGSLVIQALPKSDYFINPVDGKENLTAAYYYTVASGDFVLSARVSHEFRNTYDACALMVFSDDKCWAKICFEYTDFGTRSIVSVITNGVSDDANGADLAGNSAYLRLVKKENALSMHYSVDGEQYKMVRYFTVPLKDSFRLGFSAQSPLGDGGKFTFDEIALDFRTVSDLRTGV